jgi:transcriptional regulator with XRE-family HTH domain
MKLCLQIGWFGGIILLSKKGADAMSNESAKKRRSGVAAKNVKQAACARERSGEYTALSVATKEQGNPGVFSVSSAPVAFRMLRGTLGLTQELVHNLVGFSVRKVSGLETGEQKPTLEDARRLNELSRLLHELSQIIAPGAIAEWLETPNDYFGGFSPAQIVQKGESDRLWRLIWRLQDGVPLS